MRHSWLEQIRWKMSGFMQGRYGNDKLSLDLCKLALILWVISLFFLREALTALYLFCLLWSLFRCFSKNYAARQKELAAYQRLSAKPARFFRQKKRQFQDRKTHRYFRCKCGTMLRVPKGKGKIDIRCKICGRHMIRRT